MKFRPCIDLHNGKVKQIVGGTLRDDECSAPAENFVSDLSAQHYAEMYRRDTLPGGHVSKLGPGHEEAARAAHRRVEEAAAAAPLGHVTRTRAKQAGKAPPRRGRNAARAGNAEPQQAIEEVGTEPLRASADAGNASGELWDGQHTQQQEAARAAQRCSKT